MIKVAGLPESANAIWRPEEVYWLTWESVGMDMTITRVWLYFFGATHPHHIDMLKKRDLDAVTHTMRVMGCSDAQIEQFKKRVILLPEMDDE